MGPVHVAILAYDGRAPAEIGAAYRSALTSAGWTIPDAESAREPDADRFVAVREAHSVSVSVYREGAQTYVQTMELNALFGM